jgi:phytanoyl-CoA hydroxylase
MVSQHITDTRINASSGPREYSLSGYKENGAFVIRGFVSEKKIVAMKERMAELISEWTPDVSVNSVFKTTDGQEYRDTYFADSAEKVSFFLEEHAVDNISGRVRTDLSKGELINKVGHALHVIDPIFREYSFSAAIRNLVRGLGYVDPVLPQSMYIFKQPRIGGVVTSHQDSTFLFTEPMQSCLGLWLALDDADLENGCLWFRPGSHLEPLRRHFVKDEKGKTGFRWFVGDSPEDRKWEGAMPEDLRAAGFVPVEVKAGDLVGIHGLVDHLSLPNTSSRPRHSYQLHLVEGPRAGVHWSRLNWLQYSKGKPFPSL